MVSTRLRTLVLRCQDIDRTQIFYSALGLQFEFEQHGNGPGHYSCDLGGIVLELYPVDATRSASGPSQLQFAGPLFHELSEGPLPKALGRPRLGEDGLRFIDPDGRAVWMLPSDADEA